MGRRQKHRGLHRGRWELHRERCRIARAEPESEFREAASLGSIIPGLMKKLGLESEQWLTLLHQEWPALMGDAVAAHTRPGRLRNKHLTIFVDSSVWLSELSRYGRQRALANLQKRFGVERVAGVSFQLDPDGPRG